MEILKYLVLLSCTYCCIASHEASHSHTIPIEEYETTLQDLGQHVEYPKTPIKVIKITKTVAVKVPVPYPVKVIERVPYPVHVAKPYPVPVPQIVKVPHSGGHSAGGHAEQQDQAGYQQQEGGGDHSSHNDGNSYGIEDHPQEFSSGADYTPYQAHSDNNDYGTFESQSYDQAIKEYLAKHPADNDGNHNYH